MTRKPHMWRSYFFVGLFLLLTSCGLPDYIELKAPEPYTGTLPSTVVAFTEPSDANIIGYAVYYKIYAGLSDDDIDDDVDYFDEGSSHYTGSSELPTGDSVPNQRGFLQVGITGSTSLWSTHLIPAQGAGTDIFIDFDYGDENTDSKDREKPVVGTNWNGSIPTTLIQRNSEDLVLARGFRDPTSGSDDLLEFVADWDFDDGNPEDDGYHDGDLRRGYYNLTKQPGIDLEDIENCGDPIFDSASPDDIYIGLAVYSFGREPSNLSPLESKPVYLGKVIYTPVNDADRVSR